MITFWIVTALMLAVAVGSIIIPLIRRHEPLPAEADDRESQNISITQDRLADLKTDFDNGDMNQEEFDQTKLELEQALLFDLEKVDQHEDAQLGDNRPFILGTVIVVPLVALMLYFQVGTPEMLDGVTQKAAQAEQANPHATADGQFSAQEMIVALQQRLQDNPEDAEGWYMLGRSMMAMKRYQESADAFKRCYKLVGDEPVVMLAYADALAMATGGKMEGLMVDLVHGALAIEPQNTTALWLAGLIAEEQQQYQDALGYFERLKPIVGERPEDQERVNFLINRIREKAGMEPASAVTEPAQISAAGRTVKVRLDIDSKLRRMVADDAVVFLFAKPVDGPPMPLAAVRKQVKDLPFELILDDSLSVMPTAQISAHQQVRLGAHVSKSGGAKVNSGDLIAKEMIVPVGGGELFEILIKDFKP